MADSVIVPVPRDEFRDALFDRRVRPETGGVAQFGDVGESGRHVAWLYWEHFHACLSAQALLGKVYLTFVVERDGTVSNVNIVRSVDPLLDEEAKKTIMASPKWTPGLQRGRAVRVRFYIPLVFTLNK